ncbi:hypothetical protein [Streptomyces sp. R33]|uniref:3-oxoacyl-[acyl-carrier-protein] synthase-3 n=1 Tax=Streptomyces sp. R33 TaxID=3238629 RepID=A0AB39YHU4_9ACTN
MRFSEAVTINAAVTWLPEPSGSPAARAAELLVPQPPSALDMAVSAARDALTLAGVEGVEIDLLMHNSLSRHGDDSRCPAHDVACRIGAIAAVPLGIQQGCHSGTMALYSAAIQLVTDPAVETVLVTTADAHAPADSGGGTSGHAAHHDGAAAAVLSSSGSGLRLVAQVVHATADGDASADAGPDAVRKVLTQALAEAGLAAGDPRIRQVALPRLGAPTLESVYLLVVRETLTGTPRPVPARTGHLGCGDTLACLADITDQRLLDPGEFALVLTGDGGFTWSCLVVQQPERGEGSHR